MFKNLLKYFLKNSLNIVKIKNIQNQKVFMKNVKKHFDNGTASKKIIEIIKKYGDK